MCDVLVRVRVDGPGGSVTHRVFVVVYGRDRPAPDMDVVKSCGTRAAHRFPGRVRSPPTPSQARREGRALSVRPRLPATAANTTVLPARLQREQLLLRVTWWSPKAAGRWVLTQALSLAVVGSWLNMACVRPTCRPSRRHIAAHRWHGLHADYSLTSRSRKQPAAMVS
jgi:hypothetical protein